jgi:hypothetical protein
VEAFAVIIPRDKQHVGLTTNLAVFDIRLRAAPTGIDKNAIRLKTKGTVKRFIHGAFSYSS